ISVSRSCCSHSRFRRFLSVAPLRAATWGFFLLVFAFYQFAFSTSDQFRAGPSSPCDSVPFTAHCKLLISPPNGLLARHTVQGWAAIGAETVPMRSLR